MILSCLLLIYSMAAFAQNQNETDSNAVQIVPLVQYENLSLTSQSVQSASGGLLINGSDFMLVGLYTKHVLKEPLRYGFPRRYHTMEALLDGRKGRHQYLGIFQSESDQPVSGGINTFQAGVVYGYEMIQKRNLSLVSGGGLAVGNFGIKTSDGKNWPLIPVPLIRLNYHSNWLHGKFEFLTSPNLSFTLAPAGRVRFMGDLRMNQLRDARDIVFECALAYRPYSSRGEQGDFVGLSVGTKNHNYGAFNLGNKGQKESLEVHYYSLFAALDVSLLKISTGYAFGGRSLYRETQKQKMGEGLYVSVQGMYPF